MSEFSLEVSLSLLDRVSQPLAKLVGKGQNGLEKLAAIEKRQTQVSALFRDMGRNASNLREKLALLRSERDLIPEKNITTLRRYNSEIKKLTRQITRLETINGSRLKTWFHQAFNALPFGSLLTNPLVVAGGLFVKAIHRYGR